MPPTPISNFNAGLPKAALLFWLFGGFRCGVWLYFVILVRYFSQIYLAVLEKMAILLVLLFLVTAVILNSRPDQFLLF